MCSKKIYTRMFIVAWYITAKICKQLKCPLIVAWINALLYIHIKMLCTMKINKLQLHLTIFLNLKSKFWAKEARYKINILFYSICIHFCKRIKLLHREVIQESIVVEMGHKILAAGNLFLMKLMITYACSLWKIH